MPHRLRSTKVIHITAKLCLALVGDAMKTLRKSQADVDVHDFLIVFSALIGFLEKRPMTHNKIASFSGIPRPTVVRRVKKLVKSGILEFSRDGKSVITPVRRLSSDDTERTARHYSHHILQAAHELSKMDV